MEEERGKKEVKENQEYQEEEGEEEWNSKKEFL